MANYNKYGSKLEEKVLHLYLEEGRTKKTLWKNNILDRAQLHIGYNSDAGNVKQIQRQRNRQMLLRKIKDYAVSWLKKKKNSDF